MNNLNLLFSKNKLKRLSYIILPYIISILLILYFYHFIDAKDQPIFSGLVYILTYELIHPFMILIYFSFYIINKNIFFIFYFLFFTFYSLFFVYIFQLFIMNQNLQFFYKSGIYPKQLSMFMFDILSFLFFIVFIAYIFIIRKNIFRYLFAFFTVSSHIILNLYVLNNSNILENISFMVFNINVKFYESSLYLIPLTFAIIQLLIEFYYFYKKEKVKWKRYERMQKYKQSKSK